jgi:hypothetical protein
VHPRPWKGQCRRVGEIPCGPEKTNLPRRSTRTVSGDSETSDWNANHMVHSQGTKLPNTSSQITQDFGAGNENEPLKLFLVYSFQICSQIFAITSQFSGPNSEAERRCPKFGFLLSALTTFRIYLVLPAALWPWDQLMFQNDWVPETSLGGRTRPELKAKKKPPPSVRRFSRKCGSLVGSKDYETPRHLTRIRFTFP